MNLNDILRLKRYYESNQSLIAMAKVKSNSIPVKVLIFGEGRR